MLWARTNVPAGAGFAAPACPQQSRWRGLARKGPAELCVGLALAVGLLYPAPTNAGVEVSPARLCVTARPGEWLPALRVVNRTAWPVEIEAYLGPGGHDEEGNPVYAGSIRPATASEYPLRVLLLPTYLRPGETGQVRLQVGAQAQERSPGGLFPILYLQFRPQTVGVQAQAGSRPLDHVPDPFRIAVPVLVRWADGVMPTMQVVAVGVEPTRLPESGVSGIQAWVRVRNQAEAAGEVRVEIRMEDERGGLVTTPGRQPAVGWILPGQTRRWWTGPVWLGPAVQPARLVVSLWVDGRPLEATIWRVHTGLQGGNDSGQQRTGYTCTRVSEAISWMGQVSYHADQSHANPSSAK